MAENTGDKSKLLLTTGEAVGEDANTIALAAGDGAYYNGVADKAHMKVRNEDSTHFKAIDLVITVDPHDGFNAAAGTHYVTIEVAAPGRLGVATSTCATDSAKYVSDNIKIYKQNIKNVPNRYETLIFNIIWIKS